MPNRLPSALLLVLFALFCTGLRAQKNHWQDLQEAGVSGKDSRKKFINATTYRSLKLNSQDLLQELRQAPLEFTQAARTQPLVIVLPMPDGSQARFSVVYAPMMEQGLQDKFPGIRTYNGQGIDDPTATLKMDWTEFGFHAQVRSASETKAFYIDPAVQGETTEYISYYKKDLQAKQHIEKEVLQQQVEQLGNLAQRGTAGVCLGDNLRTYRIAVACTGEYAVAVGATTVAQALSAITTTINRVNGIFENELSIRLTLVANNNAIVFTDGTTDPFTGNNSANTLINESQTVIDGNIGSAGYDIGHTFSTGAGGLAQSPAVCMNGSKARGVTGSTNPTGDAYDVDFVAHEIGHQFGGSHTFNAVSGGCGGGNRNFSTSVEPGSGITIMGYAGLCDEAGPPVIINNLASNSIPYFHAISQNQIGTYVTTGTGSSCGTATPTGNYIPVVNAGSNYTIPKSTPFMLTGSATDINNNQVLTYSWEEIDNGIAGDWNSGNKPFFRSFAPSPSPVRTFPKYTDIINQTQTIGEFLPNSAQTLNFRLTARDNRASGSGICSADMSVSVDGVAGPFTVTSHTSSPSLTAGATTTVTWNVAGTNLPPVSATNVAILFSADGGQTYPYTLVASTPNDGTEAITVPSINTVQGRIMVKAVGNIFFNINTANIIVSSSCTAEGGNISPATTVTALRGDAALNLALTPQYSSPFSFSGQITTADPKTNLTALNTGTCTNFSNHFSFDTYTFTPSATGSYTITRTGAGSVFNLYSNSFTPGAGCTNFITSNLENTTGTSASISVTLNAGQTYVLVMGVYWTGGNTAPAQPLPFSYSFTITPPAGATVYQGSGIYVNPGAGFSYAYVVVNNTTGNIVSIGSSNLSNSTTYPPGKYVVYGISYSNSITNLNSFVGGSFSALLTQIQNNPTTFCASISKNSVTVNVTGTFPVQFTQLKARKQGETVVLDWGTVTEQNSSHFIVERSADGVGFNTPVGQVKAAGNSNTLKAYSLVDASPIRGWNYYRVKQVDADGKSGYSNTAAVNFDKDGSLLVIYPNPVRQQLNIEYTSAVAGRITFQVMDSRGAVLLNHSTAIIAGKNLETINVSSLAPGVYFLRYQDAGGNASFTKFIRQ